MPQATKKGPLPPEYAALKYAQGLYKRLRCERGWHGDIFRLLCREYDNFQRAAATYEFGVLSMWEYLHLVEATSQYLQYRGSPTFARSFFKKAYANLASINAQIKDFPFDEREKEGMRRAFDRMVPIIKRWEKPEKARE